MSKRVILGTLLIFASPLLLANETQDLNLIKEKIEGYVLKELSGQNENNIQVRAEKIDPRLNLKTCQNDQLEVFNPYQTPILGTTTMGIRCQESSAHWTLYVPIKVIVHKEVLTTKHPLDKGKQISEDDLELVKMDISQLKQGYFNNVADVVGKICKHNVVQGVALNPSNIEQAMLIHKGEQVSIQAINEMINISMAGIALNDGAIGDVISVKNLSSKRIIEAKISASRQVRVTI